MTKLFRHANEKLLFGLIGVIIPLFIVIPIIYIVIKSFGPETLYYQAITNNNDLYQSIFTTFELIIKVGLISSIIGFSLAYIVTFIDIKYRRILNILLMIPLGIPVYVAAYTYTNIYHYFPFLETVLKTDFLMNGSVFIYAMFLYPYVYIASKSYLSKHLTDYIEASQTLGLSKTRTLFKIIIPLSRPVIIGSSLFVIFESLSDFAVVEYYGVLSLSRYVNLAWFSSG
ncbi:MAG: ABC transporter permease subunit, partial [Firmicutes bacterium]|nr:ABC transporter permease subunit [Bacillota bacterium]